MTKIKLRIKHSKKCCIAKTDNEYWCFLRHYWGNIYGNEGRINSSYRWFEFRCNDTDCPAIVIVPTEEINELIKFGY